MSGHRKHAHYIGCTSIDDALASFQTVSARAVLLAVIVATRERRRPHVAARSRFAGLILVLNCIWIRELASAAAGAVAAPAYEEHARAYIYIYI